MGDRVAACEHTLTWSQLSTPVLVGLASLLSAAAHQHSLVPEFMPFCPGGAMTAQRVGPESFPACIGVPAHK